MLTSETRPGSVSLALTVLMGLAIAAPSGCAAQEEKEMIAATQQTWKHTNRLIHATSPYLLQHAHNPVDWYEWGEEAFAKAAKEDKPIFLSIGYSACHWCHVMEHESFELEAVAKVLNENFVSIKVDREERPDVDEIYMQYTQARTGHGGWPMSVVLTPQKVPFWAGTYLPRPQFIELAKTLSDAWKNDRQRIVEHSAEVDRFFKAWAEGEAPAERIIPREVISRAVAFFADRFDPEYGGFNSGGNKFPPSMAMELMLREYDRTGNERLRHLVSLTLDHMANGGIYDHLGGGICRYSTDPQWLVPHFEKMLYDQALVSSIFLDAYQVTGKALYGRRAREIFDYVIDDLQSSEGGIFSTRDADSEGLEGKFYLWTVEQVREILGEADAKLFCEFYDVTASGNWDERHGHAPPGPKNILNIKQPLEEFAQDHKLDPEDLEQSLATLRGKLRTARSQRVPPGLDDKILSGWNGLMISSLAKGARVLNDDRYAVAAARAADFVLTHMRRDGRLLCTYRQSQARLTGYLTDYAYLIDGLLNLYEATFDFRWLDEAVALNEVLTAHYYDAQGGGYYFTADDAEQLIARGKSPQDGAIPSGNAVQAGNLLRLAILFDRKEYRSQAESIFRAFGTEAENSPFSYERLLCSLDFYYGRPKEIVVAGTIADSATHELIRAVYQKYLPNKVVAFSPLPLGEGRVRAIWEKMPLLQNKVPLQGRSTAYVCEQYLCKAPVTTATELAAQLHAR